MGDNGATASSEAAPVANASAEAGYPPLQTVPPRPQLSYTVQQQREIVEALIADRENARYTSQVVRHRSGLSSLPPPPTRPEPAAPVSIEPAIAARVPEPRLDEQETLIDFLAALLFDDDPGEAAVAEPAPERASAREELSSAPQALPEGTEPARASSADASEPARQTRQAPLPPGQNAVAARLAAAPDVIDALLDGAVPQAPLPPGQSALAARLAAADQIDFAAPTAAPLPSPRPAPARSADAFLPPPIKPIVPVSAPMPPRPAEKPADDRSAAASGSQARKAASADALVRAVVASAAA